MVKKRNKNKRLEKMYKTISEYYLKENYEKVKIERRNKRGLKYIG